MIEKISTHVFDREWLSKYRWCKKNWCGLRVYNVGNKDALLAKETYKGENIRINVVSVQWLRITEVK